MRSRSSPPHIDASLAFEKDSLVIRLQVLVGKSREQGPGLVKIVDDVLGELVGQREDQKHDRLPVLGFHCKNILANTLGLRRFIQ